MPRSARIAPGGFIFHVLNRANGRLRLFKRDLDYIAFEKLLLEAAKRFGMRILDWCIMSNHFHLVLWPRRDRDLTAFMRWLTLTHAQRWKAAHDAVGQGHLYQGRFKSFIIERDEHLLIVLRYVQRNPVRAGLVERAERWRWGSCHVRVGGSDALRKILCDWPIDAPQDWLKWVNAPQTDAEVEAVRTCLKRGRPLGSEKFVRRIARQLGLEHTLRSPGRQPGWRKQQRAARGTEK
jgi:putative transposase